MSRTLPTFISPALAGVGTARPHNPHQPMSLPIDMPRIYHLASCCGKPYWRWRLPGRSFPTAPDTCATCGEPLHWTLSPGTKKAVWLRRYYRRRNARLASGLNTRGKPYRRAAHLSDSDRRAYRRSQYHARAARLRASGLTTRGTIRKYSLIGSPSNPQEIAWRQLRAEFDQPSSPSTPSTLL